MGSRKKNIFQWPLRPYLPSPIELNGRQNFFLLQVLIPLWPTLYPPPALMARPLKKEPQNKFSIDKVYN